MNWKEGLRLNDIRHNGSRSPLEETTLRGAFYMKQTQRAVASYLKCARYFPTFPCLEINLLL